MDFKFSDEQIMIRDTAEAFLAEVSTSAAVRAAMVTERGYDPDLWARICTEMYWPAIHIPEQYGGLGLGYVELVATLEQMGRRLLCAPFFASVCLAGNALLVAGNDAQKGAWLPRLVAGSSATLAFAGPQGGSDAAAVSVTCEQVGGRYRLNGVSRYVLDGHTAEWLVVAARAPGSAGNSGVSLLVLEANTEGVSRQWLPTMDQTRKQAQISFDDVWLDADALLGVEGESASALETVLDLARVALAADQVGGAQQSLDMTVDYLQERVQFGRSIASYQAVKHKCADMMVKVEAGRSALYYAACIADEALAGSAQSSQLAEAASIAKGYCSDAYFFNAGCGIQLFGGVGFTAEYDIQLYFKRAKSTETFLGNGDYHRQRLARQLLDEETI
ncbi:MAG: acyl-CoA/acyl-ACP dehydrogenase [Gammaproteobacteria bacterium]|uniref:acyl-CoA dehydrogenase family protein n=1 Tax=Pseudomaricurvus alcaniphilus TaxID=1166482 RepID=UPI00140C30BA|nr:acyl-CoA dehydrogenase family protein [Pseudomaricurvus alcaniphilus]MBR9912963.1 acyl-CoA/acyl-ACP dehydrogenase [Gammaproteobacteria bacterium]NHN36445.1 acyl-CoA/acyl-ACP dehydrogenase [Pseudomaricurvus alcaniphilus]